MPSPAPKNLLDFQVTEIFRRNKEAKTRYVRNEGGSRSSKTYSLAHLFLDRLIANRNKPYLCSVIRKTLPALKATAMKDFFDILKSYNIYQDEFHNKSENTYRIGKAVIEFFSVDESQKVHGRKRNDLWINEANELSLEDFIQLKMRTSGQIYLDYNPSEIVSWIYDITDDVTDIHSTYKDNPFNPPAIVKELEDLEQQSEWHWKVYGLGKRSVSAETIYTKWEIVKKLPDLSEVFYGLDFGYTHKTALIEVRRKEMHLWEREIIYESGLTNEALIKKMALLEVPSDAEIWADCEAPEKIQEIYNAGWYGIKPCIKGPGSVKASIDMVTRFMVHILETSTGLKSEKQSYKRKKDKNGVVMEEPVPFRDDAMAAERYAVHGHCDPTEFQIGSDTIRDAVFEQSQTSKVHGY